MKTQSPDTSLEAEQILIGMVRKAPVSKRFAFVQSWAASLLEAGSQYMQQLYPQAGDEEAGFSVHRTPIWQRPDRRASSGFADA